MAVLVVLCFAAFFFKIKKSIRRFHMDLYTLSDFLGENRKIQENIGENHR